MSESTPSLPPSNGKTVVVTGINGFIASVTGLAILKKGYTLIGTCRSRARAEPLLKDAYAEYDRAGRVKIVEVVDMTKEGAFDEVVKGKQTSPAPRRTNSFHLTPFRCSRHNPHCLPYRLHDLQSRPRTRPRCRGCGRGPPLSPQVLRPPTQRSSRHILRCSGCFAAARSRLHRG